MSLAGFPSFSFHDAVDGAGTAEDVSNVERRKLFRNVLGRRYRAHDARSAADEPGREDGDEEVDVVVTN